MFTYGIRFGGKFSFRQSYEYHRSKRVSNSLKIDFYLANVSVLWTYGFVATLYFHSYQLDSILVLLYSVDTIIVPRVTIIAMIFNLNLYFKFHRWCWKINVRESEVHFSSTPTFDFRSEPMPIIRTSFVPVRTSMYRRLNLDGF